MYKTLQIVLTIAVVITWCSARQLKYTDCGSVGAKIESLDVSPCDSDPCVLHHGTNYTINMNITASESTNSATTVLHGIIGGVPVPFPVPADGCANKNIKCPIVSGVSYTYTNSLFCAPEYPKIRLIAKWEVQDAQGKDLICFAVPLEIQS